MSWFETHTYIILAAIVLDFLIGDPRWFPHPVILIGKGISFLEKRWNKGSNRKIMGIFLTITIVSMATMIVFGLLVVANQIHSWLAICLEIYFVSSTIAIKGLQQAGKEVHEPLVKKNMSEARRKLSYIVGRDTDNLSEKEVIRGTVETIAENTVDGIISPLFWALIGGAPLAMAYRAINTLDSMVGYKNERFLQFGWASARLDDVVNYLPARLTALFMWIFTIFHPKLNSMNALSVTIRDAKKHPSPNSGWPEAMVAGLLGILLGGRNTYQGVESLRKEMGDPLRDLQIKDIHRVILIMHGAWIMFVLISLWLTRFI
ncbi:adenosylcobinamide-phosphate synthase CbiB [Bacillus sp. CGMCC 1.16607]|uniref:adenosylcobinamide-phosphate synthase CbiB n=1 Tax=Bacillus sp. CGMCC 1.16607 TaxID=3351842 RepID=UPI00363985D9